MNEMFSVLRAQEVSEPLDPGFLAGTALSGRPGGSGSSDGPASPGSSGSPGAPGGSGSSNSSGTSGAPSKPDAPSAPSKPEPPSAPSRPAPPKPPESSSSSSSSSNSTPPPLPITVIGTPTGVPCLFCSSGQWLTAAIRFINATVNYNPLTISVDGSTFQSGLEQAQVTEYGSIRQGYHTITIAGSNGYTYLRKQVYIGDGMTTLAIVNASSGIDIVSVSDTSCPAGSYSSCIRVGNLAAYSGDINVTLGNVMFSSVAFGSVTDFNQVSAGSYTAYVARSSQSSTVLLSVPVSLTAGRIYTLYVLNWNPSVDTIRTILVEDRRN